MFISQSKVRIVIVVLLLTMFGWLLPGDIVTEKANAATLNDPRIVVDFSMKSGQKVTWDCIYFGSYPQREVIADEVSYDAIFRGNSSKAGYYNKDTDIIEDAVLFSKLENATGWDSNGDITMNGSKYRRMKKSDATFGIPEDNSYYNWKDDTSYHYFKYEPIKWRVLDVNGGNAFLLADRVLDNQPYNTEFASMTWEKSTIRSWLNGYGSSENTQAIDYTGSNFINSAFTSSQRNAVKTTDVVNDDSINFGTEGGNDTKDKVFLLSESEVYNTTEAESYGFVKQCGTYDEGRWSRSSTYAKAMGAISTTSGTCRGKCWWWLRSPGHFTDYAAFVNYDGNVQIGFPVSSGNAVRPALHLNISSSDLWSYAGTVCSDGAVSSKTAIEFGKCKATLSSIKYTYNGKTKKPSVTVSYENSILEKGTDYTVSYTGNCKNVGKYKVVLKGTGDFEGTKTLYFTINPKSTSLSKLTATKKGFTAKWKKQSPQTSGYQIMYATNSSFTSGKKTVTVSSNKTISKKITKLKAKKKYYVKVRTYKKVGSKTYYSSWSKYKTVKTK